MLLLVFLIILVGERLFSGIKKKIQKDLSAKQALLQLQKDELLKEDTCNPINLISKNIEDLRASIKSSSLEAEKLNNPSTFGKYSKMQREINAMRAKLETNEKELVNLKAQTSTSEDCNKQGIGDLDRKIAALTENQKKLTNITDFLKWAFKLGVIFIFRGSTFPMSGRLGQALHPLSSLFGETDSEGVFHFTISFLWILVCYRFSTRLGEIFKLSGHA